MRPTERLRTVSLLMSKTTTTLSPLPGSAGGGAGRGSGASFDFLPFLPAPSLSPPLRSTLEPSRPRASPPPVSAFSSSFAWKVVAGKPSSTQPVSAGMRLQQQQHSAINSCSEFEMFGFIRQNYRKATHFSTTVIVLIWHIRRKCATDV